MGGERQADSYSELPLDLGLQLTLQCFISEFLARRLGKIARQQQAARVCTWACAVAARGWVKIEIFKQCIDCIYLTACRQRGKARAEELKSWWAFSGQRGLRTPIGNLFLQILKLKH